MTVHQEQSDTITTVRLENGKVNALSREVVDALHQSLQQLRDDGQTRAMILTGTGAFFSFGLDVPQLLTFDRSQLTDYLHRFCRLKTDLYLFPKPVVAAVNGHATGGGCMLVLPCDYRIMVSGKAKISLNEINLGVPVFAGSAAILQASVGTRTAETILYEGGMLSSEQAQQYGMVDQVAAAGDLMITAREKAAELGGKFPPAFAQIKSLQRRPIADRFIPREEDGIERFVDVWLSDHAQSILQKLTIRE